MGPKVSHHKIFYRQPAKLSTLSKKIWGNGAGPSSLKVADPRKIFPIILGSSSKILLYTGSSLENLGRLQAF